MHGKLATEAGRAALQLLGFGNKSEFVEKKLHLLKSYSVLPFSRFVPN